MLLWQGGHSKGRGVREVAASLHLSQRDAPLCSLWTANEAAQKRLIEASDLAKTGELKAGQQMLKEGVASGLIAAPLQRQVLAWWSAGEYDLLPEKKTPPESKASPTVDDLEAQVVRLMKERQWSRKEACQYIDEGGLDMEQMQAEMNSPMDDAFEKLKQQGPPQWFVEAMTNAQEKAKQEAEGETSKETPAVEN